MFNDIEHFRRFLTLAADPDCTEREDRARQNRCCAIEAEIWALLDGADERAVSLLARRFAALLRAQPLADGGAAVQSLLVTLNCGSCAGCYWWEESGRQHHCWLDSPRPLATSGA